MKKLGICCVAALAAGLMVVGCSGEEAAKEKEMKNTLAHPEKFDINNVPEKDREMVRRMTGNNGPPPGVSAPGGTSAPK